MRKRKKTYPIIRNDQRIYIRYPLQVTAQIQQKMRELKYLTPHVGKWIMVAALKGGRYKLLNLDSCISREFCQKLCDIHNSFHGWRPKQVNTIVRRCLVKNWNK